MLLKDLKKDYDSYYENYLNYLDKSKTFHELMRDNLEKVVKYFENISEEKYGYSYQEGKWKIYQVLQHITDTERIFCQRALRIIREDNPQLTPFDHNAYADEYLPVNKDLLIKEFKTNRESTIALFDTFNNAQLQKHTTYNNFNLYAGLIPFVCCGHELHHIKIINQRYS